MIIDGKSIALSICNEVAKKVGSLKTRRPRLAFILVGKNAASETYVRSKKKACSYTGIESTLLELPETLSSEELLHHIHLLNVNPLIDGILVQLPLPSHIDERAVTFAIEPTKDVDGFHPLNMGKMLLGDDGGFLPCTPLGIKVLLEKSKIAVEGKKVVIIGRSNIVGKPLAAMLMQKKPHCNASVTIAHSQSENLREIALSGDILVAAVGKPLFVTEHMIKPGAVVIDVGINRLKGGELVGDVDFEKVSKIASHITPVPGGVGPMTIAMLLKNTLLSFTRKNG